VSDDFKKLEARLRERDWGDDRIVARAIATLRAERDAARAVTEWRDIATAPKDGTRVLLTGLNEDRGPGRWVAIGGFEPRDGA
jgi:hypothetical protein